MQSIRLSTVFSAVAMLLLAPLALAQEEASMETEIARVGEEIFAAGDQLDLGGNEGMTFAAGESVNIDKPTGGVASVGNRVKVTGGVAGPVFVGGQDVVVSGPVAGSMYIGGQNVLIQATQERGTILAGGNSVTYSGSSAGDVYLGGTTVMVDGTVKGNLYVGAQTFEIADTAVVEGEIIYERGTEIRGALDDFRSREMTQSEMMDEMHDGGWGIGAAFGFFLFSAVVGLIVIAIMRRQSDHMAGWLADRPLQTLGTGFIGLAAWLGLTAASLFLTFAFMGLSWFFGILFVAVVLVTIAGFLLMLIGYYQGVHAVAALGGRFLPENLSPMAVRLALLVAGLFVLFLIGLVLPGLAGVLGALALMTGLGALGMRVWKGQPYAA